MFKLLTISAVFVFLMAFDVQAQIAGKDSLIKTAYADAKRFKLNKANFKHFRKIKINSYSDLFKPTKANVNDTALLFDSVYVNAYRNAAYAKTMKRRTTGHYFLMGGVIYVAVTVVASLVLLFVLIGQATK